jgi:hypothetical protein
MLRLCVTVLAPLAASINMSVLTATDGSGLKDDHPGKSWLTD